MDDDEEVEAVVMDNGTWMCKVGYAGDKTARVYERTVIGRALDPQGAVISEYIGDQARQKRDLLRLTNPMSRGEIKDWDCMERYWDCIFRQELRTDVANRPLLITEVPGLSEEHRHKMVEILVEKFKVPALYVANPAYLVLLASGRVTGVVLEIGGGVSHTAVIIKGHEVYSERSDIGGNDVSDWLITELQRKGQALQGGQKNQLYTADELKHHLLTAPDSSANPNDAKTYTLHDGSQINLDAQLSKCFDVLFEPSLIDSGANSVDHLLYDAIINCDPSCRAELCTNIIIAGGASLIPDVQERIMEKLVKRGLSEDLKIVAPPERRKSAWLGGAIFASLEEFPKLCKTRQTYQEYGWQEFIKFAESETVKSAG